MKKLLAISSLVCLTAFSFAQNLVPNPGFESFTTLPSDLGQYDLCAPWGNAQSTDADPDYYHLNASLLADLPVTSVADVSPYEGDAVMGFTATGKSGSNYREYLTVKLNAPLTIGNKYRVSFKITNGTIFNHALSGLGTDKIGVSFSMNEQVQSANAPLNATPVYETSDVIYSRAWETIRFNFRATDNSEYITIGVFGDDSGKNISFQEGNSNLAELSYYFLDDAEVMHIPDVIVEAEITDRDPRLTIEEEVESDFPFFVPNAFTPDGNGNNDVFNIIPGKKGIDYTIFVFDRWGNQIYSAENGKPEWDGRCNGALCPSDIYIWVIKYETQNEDGETVNKEETGTIHLLR
ncbi:MAG: gliding motility-associated C-terminal domain-containing protein [Flavobacteriales bacterium]